MLRRVGLLLLFIAVGLTLAQQSVSAQNIPAPSGRWVSDFAGILSADEESRLSERLANYAQTSGTQVIVVTIASTNGVKIADYTTQLGRAWKVGQEEHDNGVVILVSKADREVFIATGYGVEGALPDATVASIIRHYVIPRFKQGRFFDGLSDAADAVISATAGEYQAPVTTPRRARGQGINGEVVFFILLFVVILIFLIVLRASRNDDDNKPGRRKTRRRRSRWGRSYGGPVIIWGGGGRSRGGGWSTGGGGWSGGGGFSGGFSGGGGSFGGGGAGGSW